MDALTVSAASGLRARMESLEMLANNLANVTTGGYKADREFYSLYLAPEAVESSTPGGTSPATLPVIERHWTDFSQGLLKPTGNPLDLALSGEGFFTVKAPSGPLYTRNGSFRFSPAGLLTTAEGYGVRAVDGGEIRSQSSAPVEIGTEGTVRQDGQVLGQLEIVEFPAPEGLAKQGGSYFRSVDASMRLRPATGTQVHQGKLEDSNVGSAEGAVRLVNIMRQFEMLQRAVTIGGEMNRRAIEEVARVGS